MHIWETTQEERNTIEDNMLGIVDRIDRAQRILARLYDDYFGLLEARNLSSDDFDRVGDVLFVVENEIFDALLEYHLMVGSEFRGIGPHIESMKRAENVQRVQKAAEALRIRRSASTSVEDASLLAAQREIEKLPDDQAAPLLEELAGI